MSETVRIVLNGDEREVPAEATLAAALLGLGLTRFRNSVQGEPRAPLCGMGVPGVPGDGGRPHARAQLHDALPRRLARRDGPAMSRRECDVLVVGAGPAGIAAACRAAECGRSVLLADENPAWADKSGARTAFLGCDTGGGRVAGAAGRQRGGESPPGAAAFEADADAGVIRFEHEFETVEVHCRRLACGDGRARAVPPVSRLDAAWGGRRGRLAGAGQRRIPGGWPKGGSGGAGPLLLAAAGLLGLHGAKILGVYEQTSLANLTRFSLQLWTFPKKILEAIGLAMVARGVPLRAGWWVTAAGGANTGREWVKLTDGWRETKVECDLLACGYGLRPNTELARHWLPPERGRGRSGRIPKHQRGRCSWLQVRSLALVREFGAWRRAAWPDMPPPMSRTGRGRISRHGRATRASPRRWSGPSRCARS